MSKKVEIQRIDLSNIIIKSTKRKFSDYILLGIVIITVIVLSLRGLDLQLISGTELYDTSTSLSTRKDWISAQRGFFFDRNSNILAKNNNGYALYLVKKEYATEDIQSFNYIVQHYLNDLKVDTDKLQSALLESKYDLKIAENLTFEQIQNLKTAKDFDKYFYIIDLPQRNYIYPKEFSHIIGYTGKTEQADVENGYSLFDQIGKYKLEYQFEEKLKGVKGASFSIDGVENFIPSEPGLNITLTIDKDWQVALYKILEKYSTIHNAAGSAGVILDNSNGDVVAMVSYPGFDSNLYIRGISESQYQDYSNDRKLPLIDKALTLQIAPGSTFKLITAYTLLESGTIDEYTTYFSNRCLPSEYNFDFCEYQQYFYGQMDVVRALYKSSNLFFCVNSLELERQGNLNKLFETANLFGLGQKTGINLAGELQGNVDTPEYKREAFNLGWYSGDTCNSVIGQGSNTVTPIQMAVVASTIANKGTVYKPNLIHQVTDIYGNVVEAPSAQILRQIPMSDKTYNLINEGMWNVANYYDGTVYYFLHDVPGNIRAKTGTAEASEISSSGELLKTTHGWIVGTFEYEGNSYSFSYVLNLGGGGFFVAEIMKDFTNCLYAGFPAECK
jgi:penicillin-binding protein 2